VYGVHLVHRDECGSKPVARGCEWFEDHPIIRTRFNQYCFESYNGGRKGDNMIRDAPFDLARIPDALTELVKRTRFPARSLSAIHCAGLLIGSIKAFPSLHRAATSRDVVPSWVENRCVN